MIHDAETATKQFDSTRYKESFLGSSDFERVRVMLEPVFSRLPSREDAVDQILSYPDEIVGTFLVKQYFSEDRHVNRLLVVDLIEACDMGAWCLNALEHFITDFGWPLHVTYKAAVSAARSGLGDNFEGWYTKLRGMSSDEDLKAAEDKQEAELREISDRYGDKQKE